LITIPLAALFGTSLPNLIKTLGWGTAPVSAREQGGVAPIYSPNMPDAAGVPDAATPRLSVSGAGQVEAGQVGAGQVKALPHPSLTPRLPDDMRTVQASFNEPAAEAPSFDGSRISSNSAPSATVGVVRQASEARFEQIQRRLLGLGATYFRLESFGTSSQFYRFQCEMPLGGPSAVAGGPAAVQHAVRHFESTSENSLQAMENVLAEIEAWLRPR